MAQAVTSRLVAHLDGAADALKRMVLVAVTRRDVALADLPLHDTLIRIDPYVNEWHRTFARAGSRLNELTSVYRALALATQLYLGIEGVLHSYAVTERARRQLIPFPHLDRPRMTPAVTFLLVAIHNLFWLARNRRAVAWDEGDGQLQTLAADVVLGPLGLLAKTDTLDVGDLIAITELCRWSLDLLSRRSGQESIDAAAPAGASQGAATSSLGLATLIAKSGRQENAEIWLAAAVEAYRTEFAERGYSLPKIMTSVSSSGRFRLPAVFRFGHRFGKLRWHEGASGLSVADIIIDTNLTDPLEVLRALKHHLIHAALSPPDSRQTHGASFRKAANALGMQPTRSTRWTPAGRAGATEIAARLGPYPRPGADRPDAVADGLLPSLIALGTFSPIARIEGATEGLSSYAGWTETWPGLRALISAPEASSFRQALISRLALRLSDAGTVDDHRAAFLGVLAALEGHPGLNQEHWFDFVAGLLVAALHPVPGEAEPTRWRGWAQEPHDRSLAYVAGRIARIAEEVAGRRAEHEYSTLVWRWRDIARLALVPWLDTHGYLELCLGHWLEGLLAGGDVPTLTIGRKVCGFGLAEVVSLWQRGRDIGDEPKMPDAGPALDIGADFQEALARCRARLAALPAMQQLIRESRYFDVHARTLPGRTATDRPAIATLVRYAEADPTAPKPERPDAAVKEVKAPSSRDQDKIARAYRERGMSYAAEGEHDRAMHDFNNALKLDPNDAVAYHRRGLTHAAQGRHYWAIEDYNASIRLNPGDADVYINRGVSYTREGNRDEAIRDFSEAIAIDPKNAIAYRNRAIAYAGKGEHDHAVKDLNEAIGINPQDAIAFHNRGQSYAAKDEQDRAIRDYDEAIRLNPKYATAHFNRGRSYAAKPDLEQAIRDFDAAIRLNPTYAVAYSNRGLSYAAKGDHTRAIQDYNEAIRLDPKHGLALYNRGRSFELLGYLERARADYNVAVTLDARADDRRGQRLARERLARLDKK